MRRFCLGLAGLSVSLLGCSSTESGPPSNGGAPSAGASSAGANSAGAGNTGESGSAGTAAGAGNLAGSAATGHGGNGPSCDLIECFVANTCLDQCGGNVVYTGCCACEPPAVNQFTCSGTK